VGTSSDGSKNNWIYKQSLIDSPPSEVYVTAFYFTVTTLVTVGYGDITAQNGQEKIMCIFLMILGVVSFSISTGALASIITSYDSQESKVKEKIATLNEITNEYNIDIVLFGKLLRTIRYDNSKKYNDTLQFMEELPGKLKLELAI
jgi:Ion channel